MEPEKPGELFWEIYESPEDAWKICRSSAAKLPDGRIRYRFCAESPDRTMSGRSMPEAILKFQIEHPAEKLWRVYSYSGECSPERFERERKQIA